MKQLHLFLIRLFLGGIFFTAGMAKLFHEHRFPGLIGPVWLEDELTKYGLGFYARFIAFSQIIGGLLLFTQRFATAGAVMLFPMVLNILMITISLQWRGTPYVVLLLFLLNAYLLVWDYHKLKFIFVDDKEKSIKVPFVVRRFPYLDLVFVIGLVMVVSSPFVSYFNVILAYVIALFGVMVCSGIHVYDRHLQKALIKRDNALNL